MHFMTQFTRPNSCSNWTSSLKITRFLDAPGNLMSNLSVWHDDLSSTPMTTSHSFSQKIIQHVYFPKTSLNPTPTNPQMKFSTKSTHQKPINPNHPKTKPFHPTSKSVPRGHHEAWIGSGEELLQVTNQPTKYQNTCIWWNPGWWNLEVSEGGEDLRIMQRTIGAPHQRVNSNTSMWFIFWTTKSSSWIGKNGA